MPLGSAQDQTGFLNEQHGRFTLRRDGGGTWRLDINPHDLATARALTGKRVRVTGTRAEFDLIDVCTLSVFAPPDP